jgi:glycosyltransferase involved in cell wall biosynthesis
MKPSISLLVLTRNEASVVRTNITNIYSYLELNFTDFELIISDYSEDQTPDIVGSMANDLPRLRYIRALRRGIGAGLKAGITMATKDIVMFYPIDLSWSLETIERSVQALQDGANVVIGSRRCPGASVERPFTREIFSWVYNTLTNILFGLHVKDTQGTFALWRHDIESFNGNLNSDDSFLQTEILILSKINNLKIVEIPCSVVERRGHSNISPLKEGTTMLKHMLRFWYILKISKKL